MKNYTPSVNSVIRDYHGDADFTWTDVEVGVLVEALENLDPLVFALEQWAKHPTSPGATCQALQAAQSLDRFITWG